MVIRIPIPGIEPVIEFDSDSIDRIETPHEVATGPNGPELTGRSALVLHFSTPDGWPKWVTG